ncbi:FtsX-like permease family protein [Dactylosporangium aurantiacum]|uniref:FtsX-like permease family protein n=1 Tax=Dactylosporangium aurantiacum TaxID=35754 RepID=A0A9Q9IMW8_9ACTN|nr:FtsX-like permease family protein [Dactylosporangium aurantiacum]MDG6106018.1 FtsX-like permease family protein [Dactylosporangium aurantiacum]UWZ55935.1 FtsX-like permease family protein [Dactylosporangium aurantiacum]
MLALVLAALRARRAQAVTLLLLSTLAAAAAAAAPWYVLASTEGIATRHVEAAPIQERSLETVGQGPAEGDIAAQLEATAALTASVVELGGFVSYTQAYVEGSLIAATAQDNGATRGVKRETDSPLTLRTGACEKARIEGRCATGADEVMLSYRTARWLGAKPGDPITFDATSGVGVEQFTVTGIYRPLDPLDPFWTSNALLIAADLPVGAPPEITEPVDDAVLVGPAVFDKLRPSQIRTIVDMVAEPELFVDNSPSEVRAFLDAASVKAANNRLTMYTSLYATVDRVERDRQLVGLGVPVGAFQLLLLCWFALYLAVKYTGEERRPDVGLVKLRGATRGRTWALIGGQSAVPMLAGALVGLPLGYLVATSVTGTIKDATVVRQATALSLQAVVVAVLGALAAAMLAERRSLGASVAELLRQTPGKARAWRDLFDLVLVIVAGIALYQVRHRASGDAAGLALLAPGLAALAGALVASRAITAVAGRLVEGALRHGRPARALTAIYLARRPGVHRLAALMIVTVALLGTSYVTWDAGKRAGHTRAELEVGADRVLTVRAENRLALLQAVRAADESGRYAMAAVQSLRSGQDRVLLVDAPRLPAVAAWRPEYGMGARQAAAALHPPAPDPIMITGGELAFDLDVRVTAVERGRTLFFEAVLADPAGNRVVARVGPLQEGAAVLKAPVPACATAPGCRLSSLAITQSTLEQKVFFAARPGIEVTVRGLSDGRPAVTTDSLADRSRWRLAVSPAPPNLIVTPTGGGLLLRVAPIRPGPAADAGVYPVDTPAPLATIRARKLQSRIAGDQRVTYGSASIAEHVAGAATRLPRLGEQGVLADLEYADRLGADFGAGESMQVWIAPGAPSDLRARLEARGLIVLGEESIEDTAARYASFGPPLTLQFMLLSAVLGVALAVGAAFVVAAVERRPRARELAAMRIQGAPARVVQRVAVEGYLILVGVSLVTGVLLAVLIRAYVGDVLPYFADGWSAP